MATTHSILFSWDNVEALPDLHRLELVFRYLPGIAALQQMRGHGRNDFPVATMWRALLAGVVFQHDRILVARTAAQPGLADALRVTRSAAKPAQKSSRTCRRVNSISQPQRSTIYKTARAVRLRIVTTSPGF